MAGCLIFVFFRSRDRRRRSRSNDRHRHHHHYHSKRGGSRDRDRRHRRPSNHEDKFVGSFSEGMKKHQSSDEDSDVRKTFYFSFHRNLT